MGSPDYLQYTFKTESSTEIIRSTRSGEQPPAHYKLDVNSFSQLIGSLPTGTSFLESTEFSVGGYRWVIQIYPNGNEDDNGDGHISIYLKLCDKFRPGSFINVIFRALIYDQERNKYLIIQDLREKRFDATNAIWGMSRALPHTAFNAKCNGFLVQDRCMFGAEVFITSTITPTSAEVSTICDNYTRTYTWRVEKFSELSSYIYSPEFTIEGRTWRLILYPKGFGAEKGKHLSLYLELNQTSDLTAGNKLYTQFDMRIKNQLNDDDRREIFCFAYTKAAPNYGRFNVVPISDLLIPSKGLVMDDVMIIKVRFKQIFMLKNV